MGNQDEGKDRKSIILFCSILLSIFISLVFNYFWRDDLLFNVDIQENLAIGITVVLFLFWLSLIIFCVVNSLTEKTDKIFSHLKRIGLYKKVESTNPKIKKITNLTRVILIIFSISAGILFINIQEKRTIYLNVKLAEFNDKVAERKANMDFLIEKAKVKIVVTQDGEFDDIVKALEDSLKDRFDNFEVARSKLISPSYDSILRQHFFKDSSKAFDAIIKIEYTSDKKDIVEYEVLLHEDLLQHSGYLIKRENIPFDSDFYKFVLEKQETLITFIKTVEHLEKREYDLAESVLKEYTRAKERNPITDSIDLAVISYLEGAVIVESVINDSIDSYESIDNEFRKALKSYDKALRLDSSNRIYKNSAALYRFYVVNRELFEDQSKVISVPNGHSSIISFGKDTTYNYPVSKCIEQYYFLWEGCNMVWNGFIREPRKVDNAVVFLYCPDPNEESIVGRAIKAFTNFEDEFIVFISDNFKIDIKGNNQLLNDFRDDHKIDLTKIQN